MSLFKIVMLRSAGVPLSWARLLGLLMRRSLGQDLTFALIANHKADLGIDMDSLEAHSLAGGRVAEVVGAAVALKALGQDYPFLQLAALDLAGHPLRGLVEAYSGLKSRYATLSFEETANRWLNGEDILAQASAGEFRPLSETEGWVLRAEWSGLRGSDLARLPRQLQDQPVITVLRPGSSEWEQWREDLVGS